MRPTFSFLYLFVALLTAIIGASCNNVPHAVASTTDSLTTDNTDALELTQPEVSHDSFGEYQVLYITVADTGKVYPELDGHMYELRNRFHLKIDTANRHYDKAKDGIVVADNDEDEMYRGEYYPRRFPSENLSIEYMTTYSRTTRAKNMALVAGIFEAKKSADSMLKVIHAGAPKAFVIRGEVYTGCLH